MNPSIPLGSLPRSRKNLSGLFSNVLSSTLGELQQKSIWMRPQILRGMKVMTSRIVEQNPLDSEEDLLACDIRVEGAICVKVFEALVKFDVEF